jgi:subtilisin
VSEFRTILVQTLNGPLDRLAKGPLEPVDVCIVDSGIDATHPDLARHVISQARIEAGSEDTPATVAVPLGTNNDAYGHGTAVGGIVAAVAPNVRLIDVRVIGNNSRTTSDILLAGLDQAIDSGARIINLSLAASDTVRTDLLDLLERAYYRDQIVVAARRNFPFSGDGLPAALSACIGVGSEAFARADEYSWQQGQPIEILARGEDVTVPVPGGGYTTTFGTSYATPAVSGLCALLLGLEPRLGPVEIKAILKAHAVDIK